MACNCKGLVPKICSSVPLPKDNLQYIKCYDNVHNDVATVKHGKKVASGIFVI